MRIIRGLAKGMKLNSPRGMDVRPVQDRVKESIFSILGNIQDLTAIDIFAGSGSMGLEAISCGVKKAFFIEKSKATADVLEQNIKRCNFDEKAVVVRADFEIAIKILAKKEVLADIVFIDPPYFKNLIPKTLELIEKFRLINSDSLILAEHHQKETLDIPAVYSLTDKREYGQTIISFLKLT